MTEKICLSNIAKRFDSELDADFLVLLIGLSVNSLGFFQTIRDQIKTFSARSLVELATSLRD